MVLPLLGYDLLPLLAAHLFRHLDPCRLGIIDLGSHEGLRLRLLDDLDPHISGGFRLGWLLRR